jgi:hypothetical protein
MKNITLRAPEKKIEHARQFARQRRTTLNRLFMEWLDQLEGGEARAEQCGRILERLDGRLCSSGGPFTREEMNER